MLYPVLCVPIYKQMVWGGCRMASLYGREVPFTQTGESWDVSCRPIDGNFSVIENGPDAGVTLSDWCERDRVGTLGARVAKGKSFPLLVKIIDALDDLSVQVHPNDDYARDFGELGKNEMWYVLEPPESGSLIIGLKDGVTRGDLRRACEIGSGVEELLNRLPVKRGDMVNLPAGMVHAITRGAIIAEIQQNSDMTYRLYDYNRLGLDGKPRPLHIEHSLNVADFDNALPKEVVKGNAVSNMYYSVTKLEIDGVLREISNPETFTLYTCVEGSFTVTADSGAAEIPLSRTVFIPAGLGEYALKGKGTLLKSFVP